MRVLAPAKINLHLRVGPRRQDGFHPLLSWMTTVALFDTLTFSQRSPSADPRVAGGPQVQQTPNLTRNPISLACNVPDLPCDDRNLVVRIASALRNELGNADVAPVHVDLEKHIPIGAGLGGGSSDGAHALLALNRLWRTGRAADVLSAFAARFGSDLSFFIHGPSSICKGRGEIVRPIPRPSARWAVLVLPRLSMPTPDVYRRFDQMNLGRTEDVEQEPQWDRWVNMGSEELLPRLVNDLEPPAFEIAPALGELRKAAERLIGRPVRMSGSGSSLFSLFDDESAAREAAGRIERDAHERVVPVEVSPIFSDDLHGEFVDKE
jgi:4-diphosphocytidyl-2-C-methyl-D-erythritol kinase